MSLASDAFLSAFEPAAESRCQARCTATQEEGKGRAGGLCGGYPPLSPHSTSTDPQCRLQLEEGALAMSYHPAFQLLLVGSTKEIDFVKVQAASPRSNANTVDGTHVSATTGSSNTSSGNSNSRCATADASPTSSPCCIPLANIEKFKGPQKVEDIAWYPSDDEATFAFIENSGITILMDVLQWRLPGVSSRSTTKGQEAAAAPERLMSHSSGSAAASKGDSLSSFPSLAECWTRVQPFARNRKRLEANRVVGDPGGDCSASDADAAPCSVPAYASMRHFREELSRTVVQAAESVASSAGSATSTLAATSLTSRTPRKAKSEETSPFLLRQHPHPKELLEFSIPISNAKITRIVWDPHHPYTLAVMSASHYFELWEIPVRIRHKHETDLLRANSSASALPRASATPFAAPRAFLEMYRPRRIFRPATDTTRTTIRPQDIAFSPSEANLLIVVSEDGGSAGDVRLFSTQQGMQSQPPLAVVPMPGLCVSVAFHPLFKDLLAVSYRRGRTKSSCTIEFFELRVSSCRGDKQSTEVVERSQSHIPDGSVGRSSSLPLPHSSSSTESEESNTHNDCRAGEKMGKGVVLRPHRLPTISSHACFGRLRWRPPSQEVEEGYAACREVGWETADEQRDVDAPPRPVSLLSQHEKLLSQLWFATSYTDFDSNVCLWDASHPFCPILLWRFTPPEPQQQHSVGTAVAPSSSTTDVLKQSSNVAFPPSGTSMHGSYVSGAGGSGAGNASHSSTSFAQKSKKREIDAVPADVIWTDAQHLLAVFRNGDLVMAGILSELEDWEARGILSLPTAHTKRKKQTHSLAMGPPPHTVTFSPILHFPTVRIQAESFGAFILQRDDNWSLDGEASALLPSAGKPSGGSNDQHNNDVLAEQGEACREYTTIAILRDYYARVLKEEFHQQIFRDGRMLSPAVASLQSALNGSVASTTKMEADPALAHQTPPRPPPLSEGRNSMTHEPMRASRTAPIVGAVVDFFTAFASLPAHQKNFLLAPPVPPPQVLADGQRTIEATGNNASSSSVSAPTSLPSSRTPEVENDGGGIPKTNQQEDAASAAGNKIRRSTAASDEIIIQQAPHVFSHRTPRWILFGASQRRMSKCLLPQRSGQHTARHSPGGRCHHPCALHSAASRLLLRQQQQGAENSINHDTSSSPSLISCPSLLHAVAASVVSLDRFPLPTSPSVGENEAFSSHSVAVSRPLPLVLLTRRQQRRTAGVTVKAAKVTPQFSTSVLNPLISSFFSVGTGGSYKEHPRESSRFLRFATEWDMGYNAAVYLRRMRAEQLERKDKIKRQSKRAEEREARSSKIHGRSIVAVSAEGEKEEGGLHALPRGTEEAAMMSSPEGRSLAGGTPPPPPISANSPPSLIRVTPQPSSPPMRNVHSFTPSSLGREHTNNNNNSDHNDSAVRGSASGKKFGRRTKHRSDKEARRLLMMALKEQHELRCEVGKAMDLYFADRMEHNAEVCRKEAVAKTFEFSTIMSHAMLETKGSHLPPRPLKGAGEDGEERGTPLSSLPAQGISFAASTPGEEDIFNVMLQEHQREQSADPRHQWWSAASHAWRSHLPSLIQAYTVHQLEQASMLGDSQFCMAFYQLYCLWWRFRKAVVDIFLERMEDIVMTMRQRESGTAAAASTRLLTQGWTPKDDLCDEERLWDSSTSCPLLPTPFNVNSDDARLGSPSPHQQQHTASSFSYSSSLASPDHRSTPAPQSFHDPPQAHDDIRPVETWSTLPAPPSPPILSASIPSPLSAVEGSSEGKACPHPVSGLKDADGAAAAGGHTPSEWRQRAYQWLEGYATQLEQKDHFITLSELNYIARELFGPDNPVLSARHMDYEKQVTYAVCESCSSGGSHVQPMRGNGGASLRGGGISLSGYPYSSANAVTTSTHEAADTPFTPYTSIIRKYYATNTESEIDSYSAVLQKAIDITLCGKMDVGGGGGAGVHAWGRGTSRRRDGFRTDVLVRRTQRRAEARKRHRDDVRRPQVRSPLQRHSGRLSSSILEECSLAHRAPASTSTSASQVSSSSQCDSTVASDVSLTSEGTSSSFSTTMSYIDGRGKERVRKDVSGIMDDIFWISPSLPAVCHAGSKTVSSRIPIQHASSCKRKRRGGEASNKTAMMQHVVHSASQVSGTSNNSNNHHHHHRFTPPRAARVSSRPSSLSSCGGVGSSRVKEKEKGKRGNVDPISSSSSSSFSASSSSSSAVLPSSRLALPNAFCPSCRNPNAMTCAICESVVEGIFVQFPSCVHGGHREHVAEWLEISDACPSCGVRLRIHPCATENVAERTSCASRAKGVTHTTASAAALPNVSWQLGGEEAGDMLRWCFAA